jgi:hypothetical protein
MGGQRTDAVGPLGDRGRAISDGGSRWQIAPRTSPSELTTESAHPRVLVAGLAKGLSRE